MAFFQYFVSIFAQWASASASALTPRPAGPIPARAVQARCLAAFALGALISAALWSAAFCPAAFAQAPEKRVALVIGINDYAVKPLSNPVNDANSVAASLKKAGFDVAELTNPTRSQMLSARSQFAQKAKGADAAVIYYAGHGVELDGVNYLLPKDVQAADKDTLKDTSVAASSFKEALGGAKLVRYLILDACRDNPFLNEGKRSIGASRGLAREDAKIESGEGVGVLFATSPGATAADAGPGAVNSPFAAALARAILEPGLRLASLPGRIARDVKTATQHDQSPDYQGILENAEDWAFIPGDNQSALEAAAWRACENAVSLGPCEAYIGRYPKGNYVEIANTRLKDFAAGAISPPKRTAIANIVEWVDALGISVSQGGIPGSILVGQIRPNSPAEFQLQPNDLIVKVNDAPPDPSLSPKEALNQAIANSGRAKLAVKRGESVSVVILRPPH